MPSEKPTKDKDKSKVHKLSLKGSARLVAEFFQYSIHTILYERSASHRLPYTTANETAIDFSEAVKKYGLNMLVSSDDQVKSYIKKIMSQLDKWMVGGKISRLVIVITDKDTGEHVERWQFNVDITAVPKKSKSSSSSSAAAGKDQENDSASAAAPTEKTEQEIQAEIADPLSANHRVRHVPPAAERPLHLQRAREIENGERVQLRGFSTANHRVDTLVSYRLGD
ncbi:hypothetical protein NQ176_g10818 [Zarea fungicola]|uniref:Uncharacterized protein n=1 Tax=Zarea fungicola TaxID=93591 RepID=A0ACC1ME05_9HYPO|nr:hypothetical protein NQ176_g10818 [Lecanicillium fungicola]